MRPKRGGYELVVYLGPDPVTGNKRYRSRMFRGGKREAGRKLAELVADVGEERRPMSDAALGVVVERYLEYAEGQGRQRGTMINLRRARDLMKPLLVWRKPIDELAADDLDAVYRHLGKTSGPSTVVRVHELVSSSLRYAIRKGWLDRNVSIAADPPKLTGRDVDPPSAADVLRIVEEAERRNPTLAALIVLAATSSARRGELCGLRWRDVDFDNATLAIRGAISDQGGVVERKSTKTGKPRRIGLGPGTVAALRLHAERCEKAAADIGLVATADSYVFSQHPDGAEPYKPNKVSGFFHRVRAAVGLDHVRLHDLRHFQITTALTAGHDVRTVAGRAGHADARLTLTTYAHFMVTADAAVASTMDDVLGLRAPPPPDPQPLPEASQPPD